MPVKDDGGEGWVTEEHKDTLGVMDMLVTFTGLIFSREVQLSKLIKLNTLNMQFSVFQLYLNKIFKKRNIFIDKVVYDR